ncbi:hypothetical protein [Microbacterium sp.]|uniref:hypothetical protein n=1 Tax=Microbacterium sp. TaxID=51671 RepID=UPI0027349A00|nr:hypothetical protein [Microbacterium sp.]MDP3950587.1 hypothetical protein [Microbacterium sp.]
MTSYGPFAETTARGQTGWIDERRRPILDHLRLMLGHLDGAGKYTYSIWRAKNPESIVVRRQDAGDTFIQAAGSADAMTVEVRLVDSDGTGRLYTVGRREAAEGDRVLVPISDERAVRVAPNELFDKEEAAAIFADFYRTEAVSETYELRELDLSHDQSVQR